jgi:AraC-like DNA-binding protein
VVTRAPCPALAPFIEGIWLYEGALSHSLERVLPSGAMQLLINLDADELRWYAGPSLAAQRIGGTAFCGAFDHPITIDTAEQRRIAGVTFKPGGAAPFCAVPAGELARQHVPLDALWCKDGAVLREQLLAAERARGPAAALEILERALLRRASGGLGGDPAVQYAVSALNEGARVGAVGERLGLSPRQLIARFEAGVGLLPKGFARVRRFQRIFAALQAGRRWTDIAAFAGYTDQAHLIHDFRAFSGIVPTDYRPRNPHDWNHVPIEEHGPASQQGALDLARIEG